MTAKQVASQTTLSVRESFPSAPAQHTHAAGPVPTPGDWDDLEVPIAASAEPCALCDIAQANYVSACDRLDTLTAAGASTDQLQAADRHLMDCLQVYVRYEEEHDGGQHRNAAQFVEDAA